MKKEYNHLSVEEAETIKKEHDKGMSYEELAKKYDTSLGAISRLLGNVPKTKQEEGIKERSDRTKKFGSAFAELSKYIHNKK